MFKTTKGRTQITLLTTLEAKHAKSNTRYTSLAQFSFSLYLIKLYHKDLTKLLL